MTEPATARTWTLTFDERPWTSNGQSSRISRAADVLRWRQAFAGLAREARIPRLDRITATARPIFTNAKSMQDVSACHPAAKAAIDGLRDARVIPDDTPDHLLAVTYLAPLIDRARRRDAFELTVHEIPAQEATT